MLQIAVDHRDEIGARRQPALDHGAGQTEAVDAPQAAQARIVGGDGEGDVGGAVGRIVVDDDHLPGQSGERRLQPFEQHRHVDRFAIGRDDRRTGSAEFQAPPDRMSSRARSRRGARGRAASTRYGTGKARVKPRAGMTASVDFVAPAAP